MPASVRVSAPGRGAGNARKTIAFLATYVDYAPGEYESKFREVFHARCCELDLNLVIVSGNSLRARAVVDHATLYRCIDASRIDGVLLLATHHVATGGVESVLETCRRLAPRPLVSIGFALPEVPSVVVDNQAGLRAVVAHLVDHHRCRRVAFISGIANDPDAIARLEAYRAALAERGVEWDPDLVVPGNFLQRDGYLATQELLRRGARPDAIVAANDVMAFGALEALADQGLKAPSDVLVTGFDDLVSSRLNAPRLATVRQPLEAMAELALEQLLRQMRGEAVELTITVPAEFVARESCGCSVGSRDRGAHALRPPATTAADVLRADRSAWVEGVAALQHSTGIQGRARAATLLDALQEELTGARGAFATSVRALIEHGSDPLERHLELAGVVAYLRAQLAPVATPELEDLWCDAQSLLLHSSVSNSFEERRDFSRTGHSLGDIAGTISTALDLDALREAVVRGLTWAGIRSALVSLYIDADTGLLKPWFSLCDGDAQPIDGRPFPESRLFPDGGYPDRRRHTSMVFGLVLEGRRLGIAAFEYRTGVHGYPVLRDQICAGLHAIELHREAVHQARLRERSVQERVSTAQRMEALRVLAGGVAHDLNNSLGALVALPDVILERLDGAIASGERLGEIREDVRSIKAAATRSARTIKDLLTLGRQGEVAKTSVDLNRVLASVMGSEVVQTARRRLPEVNLSLQSSGDDLSMLASETHVARAVTNLICNAMEATEGRGAVVVRTHSQTLSEPAGNYETIPPGEYVVVLVSDTGRGISKEDLGRVFEPFFSRKRLSDSSGSGLGLAIVHSVVKDHAGFVDLSSVPGEGTTFRLYFPRSAEKAASEPPESLHPRGVGRVVVVDDDPLQRRTAERVLAQLGYEVEVLASASEAIERLCATGPAESEISVVVLDRHLDAAVDGLGLARRIRLHRPHQAIVIASGEEPLPEDEVPPDFVWLLKPYGLGALARALQQAVATFEAVHRPPGSGRS